MTASCVSFDGTNIFSAITAIDELNATAGTTCVAWTVGSRTFVAKINIA